MNIGIIGLPNVGKSSLFNALTRLSVPSENFPFTTIEPNVGVVPVPDPRLKKLGELFNPDKLTPASITFVDIAGLVKGASRGEGLGNRFLSHIREMDALVHVIRDFSAPDVVNVLGNTDIKAEKEIIDTELALADLEQAARARERLAGAAKSGDKTAKAKFLLLEGIAESLNKGIPVRNQNVQPEDIREYQFLTAKPVLYVYNVDEGRLKDVSAAEGSIALSVKLESEIVKLPPEEQQEFLKDMGAAEPGLEKLVHAGYKLLDLVTFYTVVGKEIRAWNIRRGSTVQAGAGKIHSDMEKGFIRADVYGFEELEKHGSEKNLREKGVMRSEGREYILRDGDIIRIHFQ